MKTIINKSYLIIFIIAAIFVISCINIDRNNPDDPKAGNFKAPALSAVQQLSFGDRDFDEDQISGTLKFSVPLDEVGILEYRIYWGSTATDKLNGENVIATFTADGSDKNFTFSDNTPVPGGAEYLLVYSSGEYGESSVPVSMEIKDRVVKMVKDIVTGTTGTFPSFMTAVGDKLLFTASGSNGIELYVSDGNESGTYEVKNINSSGDAFNSSPGPGEWMVNYNGTLYFSANDGTGGGYVLWKSDGTEINTEKVQTSGTIASSIKYMTVCNNTLFFQGTNVGDIELWSTNGTNGGTSMITDLNVNGSSNPRYLVAAGNTLYFTANFDDNILARGYELGKSDGTPDGTDIVSDLVFGATGSNPDYLTAVGSVVFFEANAGTTYGSELYKSPGFSQFIELVKDINPNSSNSNPNNLTDLNGTLMFTATDSNGNQLWKSNGTDGGTTRLSDSLDSQTAYLTVAGKYLYFRGRDGEGGKELWRSDGTVDGTVMVKNINDGGDAWPIHLKGFGDLLFFQATDGINGKELWISDGTEGGTFMAKDIFPLGDSAPMNFEPVGDKLFFSAAHPDYGRELWVYYEK
ncbi:hypothetical protein ACFL20_05155 [Spirochaetota bacterium]